MTASTSEKYIEAHKNLLIFDKDKFQKASQYKSVDALIGGVLTGTYSVLNLPTLQPVFNLDHIDYPSKLDSTITSIIESIELVKAIEATSDFICAAACLLQLFIQTNFTGPAASIDIYSKTIKVATEQQKDFDSQIIDSLLIEGEPVYSLTSNPHLILASTCLLKAVINNEKLSDTALLPFAKLWLARANVIYQSLLDNTVSCLHEQVFDGYSVANLKALLNMTDSTVPADLLSQHLQTIFYTELTRAELAFGLDANAERTLTIAVKASQLQMAITGVKGKRTKFQRTETHQLVLLAKSKHNKDDDADDSFDSLPPPPIALELNSDLLLDKINYTRISDNEELFRDYESLPEELRNLDPNRQPTLQDIDSALVLLKQAYIKETSTSDNILCQEEMLALANRIIESKEGTVNWCLYSRALWERSVLESRAAQTVERGTLQMQSLVEELGQNSATFLATPQTENISERLSYIHTLVPIPKWAMDSKLAEQFMSIGSIKSAIEVYERLAMWHQAALCYAVVGQENKAQEVLKDHLAKHPKDARAWSILGDINQDPELWQRAWEVGKYPGARRSLASYYYNPPKYAGIPRNIDLAIKYMNEALKINPMHFKTWFMYGCAGLETEQYELAAEAFTRCVSLEDDSGVSWSNLASALLRLDKKKEALSALKQAVKYVNGKLKWKVWSNYVTVATELQEWSEVLVGLREVLKFSDNDVESAGDVAVLEQLSNVLVRTDWNPSSLSFFQKSATELFTSKLPPLITYNPRLWRVVARVELWRGHPWTALDAYEKGFRIYTHQPQVEIEEAVWNEAVEFCGELVDAYANLGPREGRLGEGTVVCANHKFKARSAVRLLIGKGKKYWEDSTGYEKLLEIKDSIE